MPAVRLVQWRGSLLPSRLADCATWKLSSTSIGQGPSNDARSNRPPGRSSAAGRASGVLVNASADGLQASWRSAGSCFKFLINREVMKLLTSARTRRCNYAREANAASYRTIGPVRHRDRRCQFPEPIGKVNNSGDWWPSGEGLTSGRHRVGYALMQ